MDTFNFVFSLYTIILGLALTEVFGGVAKAITWRRRTRVDLVTSLLAATLIADITIFWRVIWDVRLVMQATSLPLFAGVIICGLYYLAAALLAWPDSAADQRVADRRDPEIGGVLCCILLANILAYGYRILLTGWQGSFAHWSWIGWGEVTLFMGPCIIAIFVSDRRIRPALIAVMLAVELIEPLLEALGVEA
jgi:hypothetical protein